MTENELRTIAIDTVIKYAEEQGVKLRRLDFDGKHQNYVFVLKNGKDVPTSVMVKVSYTGRWEKQLKAAKERFLNYFNARLEANFLSFSFTVNELEIIALNKSGGSKPDDEKIEKVIEKINKLLALADQSRNPSENEAILASLQVQKLLAKYNLSLTDVTGERPEEEVEQSVADVGTGKKWKYNLATAIADNYACKAFFVGAEQIVFYGYKADIVAARRVFVYLFKVGDKLANQYVKKERERYGYADGVYNSFVKGLLPESDVSLKSSARPLPLSCSRRCRRSGLLFLRASERLMPKSLLPTMMPTRKASWKVRER